MIWSDSLCSYCWFAEEFAIPADPRAAKLPKLASTVASTSKTPVKHMPDFHSVHAKSASKKISLAEHHANKLERAKMLTSQHHTIKTVRCFTHSCRKGFCVSQRMCFFFFFLFFLFMPHIVVSCTTTSSSQNHGCRMNDLTCSRVVHPR